MMLTLKQTLADQEDLASLCADRPLVTDELFPGNAYYGGDRILKEYSGYDRPLKVVIPHGVNFNDHFVWSSEARIPLPAIFSFGPHRTRAYEKESNKVVLPSASPFLYLIELLKDQPKPERKGTIIFPGHSSHHLTAQMDFAGIATRLAGFEDEYQPVTVCLYWKDYLLERHEVFRQRGFKVVSAGHMYDPYFFWRFYHLCSMHRYAAANTYSSALHYSVKAGCSFFFLESFGYREEGEDALKEEVKDGCEPADILNLIKALFRDPIPQTTPKQMKLVDYYLGTAYLQSPEGLREQFLKAEKWDKSLYWVQRSGKRRKFLIPTYYQRKIYYLAYLLKKIPEVLKNGLRGWGQRLPWPG